MRIVWLSFDFFNYGVAHVNALAADHQVALLQARQPMTGRTRSIRPSVEDFVFDAPRLRQPAQQLRIIAVLIRKIKTFNPDVIHFQRGHLWFNFALPLLHRFPLVVTIHDPRHHEGDSESRKTPQSIMDFGYRRADRVVVHGRCMRQIVRDEIRIPERKIDVIPHISTVDNTARADKPPLHSEDDNRSVLFFGRIWPYKGLDYLIQAEPEISKRIPDVRIIIAGRGGDFSNYRKTMRDPARFEVINRFVSDEEKDRLFARAAVVVLPYTSATQSGVVLDAYQSGKPVIATRVGALPEYVDDGQTGLLIPERNPEALADAIIDLLSDRNRRLLMGRNAWRKAVVDLGPDHVARETVRTYRRAILDHQSMRNGP